VLSIGAASIVAKVTRDRLMAAHACNYPDYGFDRHKGTERIFISGHRAFRTDADPPQDVSAWILKNWAASAKSGFGLSEACGIQDRRPQRPPADGGDRHHRGERRLDGVCRVKSLAEATAFSPIDHFDAKKQATLQRLAKAYLITHDSKKPARMDVIPLSLGLLRPRSSIFRCGG